MKDTSRKERFDKARHTDFIYPTEEMITLSRYVNWDAIEAYIEQELKAQRDEICEGLEGMKMPLKGFGVAYKPYNQALQDAIDFIKNLSK